MKKRIALIDDSDEIRELVAFVLESNLPCEVMHFSSGNQAIAHLNGDTRFDIIVSDFNMPDGTGLDVLNFLKKKGIKIPLAFLSGDDLKNNPSVKGSATTQLALIPKPFTDEQVMSGIRQLLSAAPEVKENSQYIAVRLQLLLHVREITAPLYVKINEQKFVRLTHDESVFTEQTLLRYKTKNITHLYIENLTAHDFITEYKKRALSSLAWNEAGEKEGPQLIKLNTELLRSLSSQLGWDESLIDLAADNITRALQIASTHPKLSQVLSQFHKIEHYGFADHCALMVLITSGLAFQMGIADEQTLRKLTFASLIHDMQLTDDEFEHQNKIVKLILNGKTSDSRDVRNILSHSGRSAELCRQWDFCPGVVDTIIFQHHEMPEGHGFPMGRTTEELHPLSRLFIVAEDFANYFVDSYGEPDLKQFLKLRSKIYHEPQFKAVLKALAESLPSVTQTAS